MNGRLVTEEEIRGLVVPADAARPLGFVYFCDLEEEPTWRATAFVIRVRRGGFLAAGTIESRMLCSSFAKEKRTPPSLRRAVLLERLPGAVRSGQWISFWPMCPGGSCPSFETGPELIPMSQAGTTVRPVKAALQGMVDSWIGGIVDAGRVCHSRKPGPFSQRRGRGSGANRLGAPGFVAPADARRLAARVRELEKMMANTSAGSARPDPLQRGGTGVSSAPSRSLGNEAPEDGTALTAEDWATFRAVAGPAGSLDTSEHPDPRPSRTMRTWPSSRRAFSRRVRLRGRRKSQPASIGSS